jgi:DnaJ-class molecular chaperone
MTTIELSRQENALAPDECPECLQLMKYHDDGFCPVKCDHCHGDGTIQFAPWEPTCCAWCGGSGLTQRKDAR